MTPLLDKNASQDAHHSEDETEKHIDIHASGKSKFCRVEVQGLGERKLGIGVGLLDKLG
jgi:hypothetical protein